ncbi:eukaryotic translation initiation factor 2A [Stigmatopora nigra]
MAPPVPLVAVRGSDGTWLLEGPPAYREHAAFPRDPGTCRSLTFSRDGSLLAWCNGKCVRVTRTADGSPVAALELPKTARLEFSPLNNVLVTWQPYTKSADAERGEANLGLWELPSAGPLKAFYQKKVEAWCPGWSADEKMAVRMVSNELHFFEDNNFGVIANKLHMDKVSDFELSPGSYPGKVCVYVPGSKGAPSFVRLYQYPRLDSALATKSFYKADHVGMLWNKKASGVLVTASMEVDKSGASYYGEQTLHFLHVNGETAHVQLAKNGPIYDVAWSPNSTQFCVVYGFMPAKATVFDLKCDAVFDFGTGPRNSVYYSPRGNVMVLAGFGNLRGHIEVWDAKKYKQVSKAQAENATHFSWCPDGEHFLTATCSPRLRVGNGFQVRHYAGGVAHERPTPQGAELWEVRWQPFPEGIFPERAVVGARPGGEPAPAPALAYRPPALRHLPAAPTSKLHEEEAPQNARGPDKTPSKAALKNQKKREARKAAKQERQPEAEPPPHPAPEARPSESAGDTDDADRKMKNVKKKLKAIEELKEQRAAGKVLQKNQLDKMQKEAQLLEELKHLELHAL